MFLWFLRDARGREWQSFDVMKFHNSVHEERFHFKYSADQGIYRHDRNPFKTHMTIMTHLIVNQFSSEQIYQDAEIHNVWKGECDSCIHLFHGEVVENDAPGSGSSEAETFFEIAEGTIYRKTLEVRDGRAERVQVAFIAMEKEGHDATLLITVNGHAVERPPSSIACPDARQYIGNSEGARSWSRWYYVDVPPETLREGTNEIIFQTLDARPGWMLMIADYQDFYKGMAEPVVLPHGSALSRDGGESWRDDRGEYVLRFALDRYRPEGEVISPVIDSACDGVVKPKRDLHEFSLDWQAQTPDGTGIRFYARTGSLPFFHPEHWNDWAACSQTETIGDVAGRYLQWKAVLSTDDPALTPALENVAVSAVVEDVKDAPAVRIIEAFNEPIFRSSYEFVHEDYLHPTLQELREKFELDSIVAGCQTEFEKIERLLKWSYLIPMSDDCPIFPWKVLDWLVMERDEHGAIRMNEYETQRRDKMCLFPNVALMAAYLSMGFPARHVNIHSEGMTGHEIAEVWSNDYRKWVHVDATRDYYWYDKATRVPLDTWEIRKALVDRLERPERWDRPYLFHQDVEPMLKDLPIAFREGCHPISVEEGALYLFQTFCHFRIVPRSDIFSREGPLPISQGREVWSWNGYMNWADDKVPPLPHFTHHTNRRPDMFWSLNQAHITLEQGDTPDTLQVHLETETPNFDEFLVQVDHGNWKVTPSTFRWEVHQGINSLQARPRNTAGVEGIISSVTLEV